MKRHIHIHCEDVHRRGDYRKERQGAFGMTLPAKKLAPRSTAYTKEGRRLELFKSTYKIGNRFSVSGRETYWKVRGASIGVEGFNSLEDAEKFLTQRGWVKESDPTA